MVGCSVGIITHWDHAKVPACGGRQCIIVAERAESH